MRRRGPDNPAPPLIAEVAIAVFRTAFERWINRDNDHDFPQLVRDSLDQLNALTAA